MLMLRLIWTARIHTRDFLHRYMPTNIVLEAIRTRSGLKWGLPAMLLAIPYLAAANILTIPLTTGHPDGSTCWCCCVSGTCSSSWPWAR